ncbi:MAG: TOBE domain-containing protein [Thiolinea sp.]
MCWLQAAGGDSGAGPDLPMVQGNQASAVIQATVCGYEPEYHLTQVCFAGGRISLPFLQPTTQGTRLRLRIYARDVSLTLQRPQQSSILNILPATITDLAQGQEGRVIVSLSLEGVPLLAHITCKSVAVLGLQPGMTVFAQIKATAIL